MARQRRSRSAGLVAFKTPAQASKTLMVLGLLGRGPLHGYELHRIVVAHGALYADFKKPTLYHLLARLAEAGAVAVASESGARGRRGERLTYSLTGAGRALFADLLRDVLSRYEPVHTGLDVAIVFMMRLPAAEARRLLRQRRACVLTRRRVIMSEIGADAQHLPAARIAAGRLAADHALALIDAELAWIDRATASFGRTRKHASHGMRS